MKSNALLVILITFIFFTAQSQIIEDFSTAHVSTSYSTGTFVGADSIRWNYVNARGGQFTSANRNSSISLNKAANACIFSDTLPLGIKFLQFQWEQELTSNCNAGVFINDSCVAILCSSAAADSTQICTIDSIYFTGNIVITIKQNASNSGQITIDDIQIQYAEKPFVPFVMQNFIETDTTIIATFSREIQSIEINTVPLGLLNSFKILGNNVSINCNIDVCGNFTVYFHEVLDTGNNYMGDTIIYITKTANPLWKSLVITEIMADPTPSVGLPENEYIEIYNTTDCNINLNQIILKINDNNVHLPTKIISANSYLILISDSLHFKLPDSLVCIVPNLPAITNEGVSISICTLQDQILSQVKFADDWYRNNFKETGGWALEKIDVLNYSETIDNWSVAQNYTGGTPGHINSVSKANIDVFAPYITNIYPINDTIICINFSENMDPAQIENYIQLSNGISIHNVFPNNYSLQSFGVCISKSLQKGNQYECEFTNICADIQGNIGVNEPFVFALTDSILHRNSILFSEILVNPKPGEFDIVELYNPTNLYFNCADLYMVGFDTISNDVHTITQISDEFLLLAPGEFLVISEDIGKARYMSDCKENAKFIEMPNMPTMSDEEGTVMLVNKWGYVIDSLHYSEDWHSDVIADTEGVSLERVSYSLPTQMSINWNSAFTITNGSSMGCKNSQSENFNQNTIDFNLECITPNNDGYDDLLTVTYTIIENNTTMNMHIFTVSGNKVATIANNDLPGTNGVIRWEGLDESKNLVPPGIYIVYIEIRKNGKQIFAEKKLCTVLY